MQIIVILSIASALLAGLLLFERTENRNGLLAAKTLLSSLFVLTALVQPHPLTGYGALMIAGLILCLGGDVFLALPGERMFLFGLVSFLLGHILYLIAFFLAAELNRRTGWGSALFLCVSGGIFFWLRPSLDRMEKPVLAYVIVITLMVSGAWTVLGDFALSRAGRWLVFIGAHLFYFSDIFVARDRFRKQSFVNRLVGLPLYYAGQFLLAFSIGRLG